jgi:sporulation-control protein
MKKLLRALGISGATVDTVLDTPDCRPGGSLRGRVRVDAGDAPVEVEHLALDLVARFEVEDHGGEHSADVEFHRIQVAGRTTLAAGSHELIPFELTLPWETPVTTVYGQHLRGMTLGLRTELSVAWAVDKGDLDPIAVHPLPAQERILDAFVRLGFHFKGADLEHGMLRGSAQTLPFYQEIEFYPPPYAAGVNEVELTFLAGPDTMDVILEADRRGGVFTGRSDAFGRLHVDYATAGEVDWAAEIGGWIRHTSAHRVSFAAPAGHGPDLGGYRGHDERHRGGAGLGGVAAGFAGGMVVAGGVVDEAGDLAAGDEDEG